VDDGVIPDPEAELEQSVANGSKTARRKGSFCCSAGLSSSSGNY
jgi:hypothetical protein